MTWSMTRWQDYYVQAKHQSPMNTNKGTKNEGAFEKKVFNEKNFGHFRRKKRIDTKFLDLSKTPSGTHGP